MVSPNIRAQKKFLKKLQFSILSTIIAFVMISSSMEVKNILHIQQYIAHCIVSITIFFYERERHYTEYFGAQEVREKYLEKYS